MWMSYFEKVVVCFPIVYKMELGNFSFILILVFFSLRAVSLFTQRTRERARKSPRLPLGHLATSSHSVSLLAHYSTRQAIATSRSTVPAPGDCS